MAGFRDWYDYEVTTSSSTAMDHYLHGLRRLLMNNADAENEFDSAVTDDEEFALAHGARALMLQMAGKLEESKASIAIAKILGSRSTRREQQHIEILARALEGQIPAALDGARQHLHEYPYDALILRQTRFWLNQSGRKTRKEEALGFFEDAATAYGADAWFLAHHSFMHNELFNFARARELAEQSYALEAENSECAHSLAHVFFETGSFYEGSSFLEEWLDGSAWQRRSAGHLTWHLALFEIEQDRWDSVTELYNSCITPGKHEGQAMIVLADSASLLWRYSLAGKPLASTPEAVREYTARMFPRTGVTFADAHKALAYALSSDWISLSQLAAEVQGLLEQGRLTAGPVVPALIEAVQAFAQDDYDRAIAALEPYTDDIVRVGGSHAQFDVFGETLLAAYLRAGAKNRALPLIRQRLERRPAARDEASLQELVATP